MGKNFKKALTPGALPAAIQAVRFGRLNDAERLFKSHLVLKPDDIEARVDLAILLAQLGRGVDAEIQFREAVDRAPNHPGAQYNLGAFYETNGRLSEAQKCFEAAAKSDPKRLPFLISVSRVARLQGDFQTALSYLRKCLEIAPKDAQIAIEYGETLRLSKRPDAAVEFLATALQEHPADPRLLKAISSALVDQDKIDDVIPVLDILAQVMPKDAETWKVYGMSLARLRRYEQAATAFEKCIEFAPKNTDAYRMLSGVQTEMGQHEKSVETIECAAKLANNETSLLIELFLTQYSSQSVEKANQVVAEHPENLVLKLAQSCRMPVIADSSEEIDSVRARMKATLEEMLDSDFKVDKLDQVMPLSAFFLGYHGREDRELIELLRRTREHLDLSLKYVSKNLERRSAKGRRLRIGFLSAFFRSHSVGRVLNRFLKEFDRDQFEVVLLEVPGKYDWGQGVAREYADRPIVLPPDLRLARTAIEAEECDAILFGECVMDVCTDFLAHSRLAPVQATTWGHPGTTGSSTIDGWISCTDWEPDGNERLYTEKLIRLSRPPMIATAVDMPERFATREELGLPDKRIYACPQSIYKLHPEFDSYMVEILRRDPEGIIVFIDTVKSFWSQKFQDRLKRAGPDVFDRMVFLETLSLDQYLSLLHHSAVSIDPIHFGGANTSMEAFTTGLPVVTQPGSQLRNRQTVSFYRMMEMEDLVVDSKEAYVDLAVKIGTDSDMRKHYSNQVKARCHVIFDTVEVTREMESYFRTACEEVIG